MQIVDGLEGAHKVEIDPNKKVAWLSQTTLSVDETLETTSKPTKTARTVIEITAVASIIVPPLLQQVFGERLHA